MDEPTAGRDSGFTLVELLISIVLVAVLAGVVVVSFSVIVRTTPQAEARADDARSLLGLSTWLPSDLSSTPHTLCTDAPNCLTAAGAWNRSPSTPSGCAGTDAGINVLRLVWTESFGSVATTSTFVADYRFAYVNGGWKLYRVACVLGGARRELRLSSDLPPPANPATWAAGTEPIWVNWKLDTNSRIVAASFEVKTIAGDLVRIDGSSNNVNTTLPPLGAPPPPPPPTPPPPVPVPCTAAITSVSPNPAKNQEKPGNGNNIVNGPLWTEVAVNITKDGSCGDLGLEYYPQPSGAKQWKPFGSGLQVILPAVALEPWSDGDHVLLLRDGQLGGQVGTTFTLVVT
jgi:prepilin-type N-terminal cleavage/methylation domain-containing protein